MRRRGILLLLAWLTPAASPGVEFLREVQPILRRHCWGCHGASVQSGGLRLDQRDAAQAGGYSGQVLTPGNAAASRLYRLVAGLDPKVRMPPAGARLTPAEVEILRKWIDEGAAWPAGVGSAVAAARPQTSHWAFQPPRRPAPPTVRRPEWVRNAIDAFVLARLEAENLSPSPEADPSTLVRRLHLDLTGLPPAPDVVARYLASRDPRRYERLVEDLLASPHFGEKWARHWLDLSRYSDSEGNESDFPRPYAWRYRHWLIEQFNRDLPFDEFTVRQIAGDLLPHPTPEDRAGLGFHRNTSSNREGGADIEAERVEQVVDRTNAVGLAWLGLTVGCARCHDHKYDPISQKEYFQLYAFFNNADEVNVDAPLPGEAGEWLRRRPAYERKRRDLLCEVEEEAARLQARWEEKVRWAADHPGKDHVWDRQLELLGLQWEQGLGGGQLEGMTVLYLPPAERTRRQRETMQEHFLGRGSVIDPQRFADLGLSEIARKLAALNKEYPLLTQAPSLEERRTRRRANFIHLRGDFRSPGIPVAEDVPGVLPPFPASAPRNRLGLARWLLAEDHPLTARVTVNRVWQEMFGRGIVATPDDFGAQGSPPSHPALLDWLAAEFREQGWSFKQLLRTIVQSSTYRQASHRRKDLDERDPANTLLARQSRFRLAGELVRDAALAVSGLLHPAIGGPSVRPPQPAAVSREGFQTEWVESTGPDRYRRGLYTHMQRTAPYAQLVTFDAPDPNLMCARRERSNSPLQALTLLNDPVFFEAAQALARRVLTEAPEPARLDYAFRLCFGRAPSASERDQAASFLARERDRLARETDTSHELFPAHLEGIEPRTAAAWTLLASGLLNTDEFVTRE
jgi:mono/diheme cytochrome c family protein